MFILPQVQPYIAAGKLCLLLNEFEIPARPIHLVYPNAQLLPARTHVFIAAMKQALNKK